MKAELEVIQCDKIIVHLESETDADMKDLAKVSFLFDLSPEHSCKACFMGSASKNAFSGCEEFIFVLKQG